MLLFSICSVLSLVVVLAFAGKLPDPEVKIEVLHQPLLCQRKTKYGDMLLVHHEGYLDSDGTMFHSSRLEGDRNPVWFTLGNREVILGWDKGLLQMCAGERRKLTVPPSLAYGKEGRGKIPPSSTLIFDIELVDIRNGPRSHDSFREMDLNDDWKLSREEVKQYLENEFKKHGHTPNDTQNEAMVDDIFKYEDEDKDGFISSREFTYQHDEL
ncbi:peptidyl-prolyl cis-trans isomerase FKBP14 [Syngnathus typhle]|uniref:peptidyl-prolyl cis-trans isomerase FKBP14 n=1 Tax=Syngnathus typhle TaxID=161592 RepID=UPI002A6B7A14|nr:peptidyl-prolyl cis-trans isomerase FKBP14 [Syngnathus typhle]